MKIQKGSDRQTGLLRHNMLFTLEIVALEKALKPDQPKIGMDIALLMAVFDRCSQAALMGD